MNTDNHHSSTLEKQFEQATEDTSTYLWALESWLEPSTDYTQDYLLLQMLVHRARSRLALKLIKFDNSKKFKIYREKLEALFQKAENTLSDQIETNISHISEIINNSFILYLDELTKSLGDIRHIVQDGDLFEDSEWVTEELRETAHDFLLKIEEMFLVQEELNKEPFESRIQIKPYLKRLNEVDILFKSYFGYFYAVSDLFDLLKEKGYGLDRWWFNRTPEPEDIQEGQVPKEIMTVLSHAYQKGKTDVGYDCTMSEMAIEYGLGHLEPQENKKIKDHLLSCRYCTDLVIDIRIAEIESVELRKQSDSVLPALKMAISAEKPSEIMLEKIKRKVDDILQEGKILFESLPHAFQLAGQPVTAADSLQQSKTFLLGAGEYVNITCDWQQRTKNVPSYIHLEWKANITTSGKLWARFINSVTGEKLNDLFLGNRLEGRRDFESHELGFDPIDEQWAISIIFERD